jgi:hypothetical protein
VEQVLEEVRITACRDAVGHDGHEAQEGTDHARDGEVRPVEVERLEDGPGEDGEGGGREDGVGRARQVQREQVVGRGGDGDGDGHAGEEQRDRFGEVFVRAGGHRFGTARARDKCFRTGGLWVARPADDMRVVPEESVIHFYFESDVIVAVVSVVRNIGRPNRIAGTVDQF